MTDNTDLLLLREALELVRGRLVAVIDRLARFAAAVPRPALPGASPTSSRPSRRRSASGRASGPTTSCSTWPSSSIASRRSRPCGVEGHDRHAGEFPGTVRRRPRQGPPAGANWSAARSASTRAYAVTGQTYSRKIDAQVLAVLSGIAQSAHKMATDLRLLAAPQGGRRAVREGADRLVGDGLQAQPDAERADLLAGPVRDEPGIERRRRPLAMQWLERTLDDSANRRLVLPQAFLAIDAVLILCQNVTVGPGRLSEGDRRATSRPNCRSWPPRTS